MSIAKDCLNVIRVLLFLSSYVLRWKLTKVIGLETESKLF